MPKQKLELTWVGKDQRPKLEPRILLEDPELSYHAKHKYGANDQFDNRLIFGDNLLALKALEQEFTGKVKCIYIDPPFNTQQAFQHYDDGVEHSLWLQLMRDRIIILHKLLSYNGSIFIHIDDNELGYLIALVDEIFGRKNRISIIAFKQSSVSGPKAINPGLVTTASFIIYYCKDRASWSPNRTFMKTDRDDRYSKFISNYELPFKQWNLIPLKEGFARSLNCTWDEAKVRFAEKVENKLEEFVLSNSQKVVRTARVAPNDVNEDAREALLKSMENPGEVFRSERNDKADYYFLSGEQLIFYSTKTKLIDGVLTTASPASNIWDDLLSNNLHKEGAVTFPNGKKPEFLLKRIIEIASDPGDIILDSFGGSGTTGAVAHKMGRRWVMVELGQHCHTHIVPRIQKVIDGVDQVGVSKAVNWQGGGGFRYFKLAPTLLTEDKWGNLVINPEYNASMLAEALCKLEGFQYKPSETVYWQQGQSTEADFIYTTTQTLGQGQLEQLSEEVGTDRTLLVLCNAFKGNTSQLKNLTVKKIPKHVLHKCEWGQSDYNLQIANLPDAPPKDGQFGLSFGTQIPTKQ